MQQLIPFIPAKDEFQLKCFVWWNNPSTKYWYKRTTHQNWHTIL